MLFLVIKTPPISRGCFFMDEKENRNQKRKKSEKEIANEKSNRILLGVAIWAAFYRFRNDLSKNI